MTARHGLGPLEMRVLGSFEGKAQKTVSDVRAELERSGSKLAYTTVMTVLSRLHEKGMLTRERDGKRFYYAAARGTPGRAAGIVARVHRALFKTARMRPLAPGAGFRLTPGRTCA
jgi:predicted transcriptional regulator